MPNSPRVSISLRWLRSIRDFLTNWLMDISITNPRFDELQQLIGGLNEVLAHPERFGLHDNA